jgi:hypothetical protein
MSLPNGTGKNRGDDQLIIPSPSISAISALEPKNKKGGPVGPPFSKRSCDRLNYLTGYYFLRDSPPKRLLNWATRPPS